MTPPQPGPDDTTPAPPRCGPGGGPAAPRDPTERPADEPAAHDVGGVGGDLHTVAERVSDGLVVVDARGVVVYANPAAVRMLGARNGLTGLPVGHALYGGDARSAARSRLATDRASEDVFRRGDGGDVHVSWSATTLSDEPGREVGRAVVFRDVAEHRAREARLDRQAAAQRWAGRLREALDGDRFVLHAQPIVATDSRAVVDRELLLRLTDDDGRVIPPGAFLPAAEELGTIVAIDRWVAIRAVRCAADGMPVHFNLSGRTIGDDALLLALDDELRETGADARDLTVEVTETARLGDGDAAAAFIARLRRLGCRVALDDFGTGYNGLGRVHEIAADSIKVDRRFVSGLAREPASESVVRALLAFAGEMGLGLVAEGVEDEATADRLRQLGVPHAQGFHFGRPEPLAPLAPVG